jgi:hypothetical protein
MSFVTGGGGYTILVLDLDFQPANDLYMTLIDLGVRPLPGDGVQHAGAGQVQRAGQQQARPSLLTSIVLFYTFYDNLFSV